MKSRLWLGALFIILAALLLQSFPYALVQAAPKRFKIAVVSDTADPEAGGTSASTTWHSRAVRMRRGISASRWWSSSARWRPITSPT